MELIFAGFAEYDNRVRGERTAAGMRAALQNGYWTFQVPLGYQKSSLSIESDPGTGPIIAKAFQRIAGGQAKDSVLGWVTRRGLRSRTGGKITPRCFGRILRNPLYAGQIRTMGVEARGSFRPLIPEELFERVQLILDGKKLPIRTYARSHPDFPLRQFVSCQCGRPLTASWSKGRNGRYAYYHCPNPRCRVRTKKDQIEEAFLQLVRRLQPDPDYSALFMQLLRDAWESRSRQASERQTQLTRELDAVAAKLSKLRQKHIYEESISANVFHEESARLDAERQQVRGELAALKQSRADDITELLQFAERLFSRAAQAWEQATVEQRQRLQQVYFPNGLTYSGSEFRTATTCLFFKHFEPEEMQTRYLASPTGFANMWTFPVRCSTR